MIESSKLLSSSKQEEALIASIAKDIQQQVFNKRANITEVDKITKTIQTIIENHGLSINPESITAMKAQMQFFTSIKEVSELSGKTSVITTIIKDIPQALLSMLKNATNPIPVIKDAIKHCYKNQTQATSCIYQFLAPKCNTHISLSYAIPEKPTIKYPLLERLSQNRLSAIA